jgi:hypothetical protein
MKRVNFAELPWGVRIVLGLAAFNFWMSIEDFVINRSGVWRYMPGYKVADACIWDLMVGLGVCATVWWFSWSRSSPRSTN